MCVMSQNAVLPESQPFSGSTSDIEMIKSHHNIIVGLI